MNRLTEGQHPSFGAAAFAMSPIAETLKVTWPLIIGTACSLGYMLLARRRVLLLAVSYVTVFVSILIVVFFGAVALTDWMPFVITGGK